ncbi:MAG: hypothetical protein IPL19_27435 [Sandaracinaceae bacterium]|nr:hypothetical protein [Sandaracinaceae bacterium]MBK7154455.1 hypothetical protein [Sandaracinaceae bacterium]MBK8411691.1 hypothetical protein [Sandaracinaceae bacterium]
MRSHHAWSPLALSTLLGLSAATSGCVSWEELPAGATGFLVVDQAELSGTVDGAALDPSTTEASGYCISAGWRLELRAETVAGDPVVSVIEVVDLDMQDRDATVQFVERGPALLVEDASEAGQLKLWTCVGDESAPEFEQEASEVTLDMATNEQGDIEVTYTATFDNGDAMQGQFEMEMPVVD